MSENEDIKQVSQTRIAELQKRMASDMREIRTHRAIVKNIDKLAAFVSDENQKTAATIAKSPNHKRAKL